MKDLYALMGATAFARKRATMAAHGKRQYTETNANYSKTKMI